MERELIERRVGRAPSVERKSYLIFETSQTAWNSLPDIIPSAESINSFNRLRLDLYIVHTRKASDALCTLGKREKISF